MLGIAAFVLNNDEHRRVEEPSVLPSYAEGSQDQGMPSAASAAALGATGIGAAAQVCPTTAEYFRALLRAVGMPELWYNPKVTS